MGKLKDFMPVLLGHRKFLIMLALVSISVTFRLASLYTEKRYGISLLSGAEMTDLLRYTSLGFFASNAGEHMTEAIKEWAKKKATTVKGQING